MTVERDGAYPIDGRSKVQWVSCLLLMPPEKRMRIWISSFKMA